VIKRLLIANRGEISRRVTRTCRKLGIEPIAVFSDADAQEPFVAEAGGAVRIGGSAPSDSYLQGARIIDAARRTRCDAIHPGYGFLSEDPGFAEAVMDAGLVWVGPPPEAMRQMGSKVQARMLMERAGIPVVPGSGPGDAASLGLPLLVKASAGGGGKGMRVVRELAELDAAIASARREAESAFGDGTIFLERYVERPHHVEIQIFGDQHGNVIALGERDCSVQRRHQKVIEEAPSPIVDPALRRAMSDAAVAAGRELGYVGAGTVEFLVTPGGEFFFLEVNTRLQVEHPVTELVWGLDLVAMQIEVAEGAPIPPGVVGAQPRGHAIEARLYAEDPAQRFLPQMGTLARLRVPGGVRVDAGVGDGSLVSPYYDPMLAKIISHGPTRAAAARSLIWSLRHAEIDGLVTNRDLLVRILEDPAFAAGTATTDFLDSRLSEGLAEPLLDLADEREAAVAAAIAEQARRRLSSPLRSVPSGFRTNPSQPQIAEFRGANGTITVAYRFDRTGQLATLEVDGTACEATVALATPDAVVTEADGVRLHHSVRRSGGRLHLNGPRGQTSLESVPRFQPPRSDTAEGSLVATTPGTVVRVDVAVGDPVDEGQRLLVLEAMKMEHEFVAPAAGTIQELCVAVGDRIDSGTTVAVLENGR
jgi:propionyl-CoA carboxylase alpha chain